MIRSSRNCSPPPHGWRSAKAWSYRGGALTADIVPFGGLEKPPGEIAWLPDFATRMGVTGFTDVHDHCIRVTVSSGVVVKVVSLPGFAILKLIAWGERKDETTRDGADIGFLCQHYGPACTYTRLTGEDYDVPLGPPPRAHDRWQGKGGRRFQPCARNAARAESIENAPGRR